MASAAQARERVRRQARGRAAARGDRRAARAARVEPQLQRGAAGPSSRSEAVAAAAAYGVRRRPRNAVRALPAVPGFDPEIDYIVAIDAAGADQRGRARRAAHARPRPAGKRFRVAGYNVQRASGKRRGGFPADATRTCGSRCSS